MKIVDYDGQSPSCSVSGAEKRFFVARSVVDHALQSVGRRSSNI